MSKTTIFVILAVAAVLTSALPQGGFVTECGPNEEFNTCGSSCEPTCQNPSPTVCVYNCFIGCQCKSGFLRNPEGSCILARDCSNY